MKSKKEIEEKLGFSLEYREYTTYVNGNDWNNFMGETIHHRTLEPKSVEAVEKLLTESLENGDIETAQTCENILRNGEIAESKELKEKKQELREQFLDKYVEELQNIDVETLDKSKIEDILKNIQIISGYENSSSIETARQRITEIIENKIESKIQLIDSQISDLKDHIELPENEQRIEELQQEIEDIEEMYIDCKTQIVYDRKIKSLNGNINSFNIPDKNDIRRDLQRNKFNHKTKRLEEQGIDISQIMDDIEKTAERKGRISQNDYDRINEAVARKSDYLEGKLAYLQQYRDIPGNEERIAEIESQLEEMQDSWLLASNGIDLEEVVSKNTETMRKYNEELEAAEKKLQDAIENGVPPVAGMGSLEWEDAKKNYMSNCRRRVDDLKRRISDLSKENKTIQDGTHRKYLGQHHKDRLDREERETIEELASKIAELEEHIEIPENENKIVVLQKQLDEIECSSTQHIVPHKRTREQEQGKSIEQLYEDIDDVVSNYDSRFVESRAERVEGQIKTKISYLEKKLEIIQQHIGIEGNKERAEEIQKQIESLEDRWNLCVHGFGSEEQMKLMAHRAKYNYKHSLYGLEQEKLDLTPEQIEDYWNRIQEGQEIPELMGEHHKLRIVREKQEQLDKLQQEYGINGITDRQSLQARLEYTVSEGIRYGASRSEYGDKKMQDIKQVLPQFDEFKRVYLQLRENGIEDKLYENLDFENVSYSDLLQRATLIMEEKAKTDELAKIKAEQEAKARARAEEQARIKAEQEARARAEEQARIKAEQEAKARAEEQARIKAEQEAKARAEEQARKSTTSKMYDEQQEELVKPREKSFRDQIGDDLQKENENKEMQPRKDPTIEMWMNRFGSWYSAIDRVSQNVKAKFVQMKSEIVNAIKNKIQERENRKEKIEQQNKEVEEEGR